MNKYIITLLVSMFCLPSVAQDKPSRLLGADISMLPKYEEKKTEQYRKLESQK